MSETIKLDGRRRAALGKHAVSDYYFIESDADTGVITLTPAVILKAVTEEGIVKLALEDFQIRSGHAQASNEPDSFTPAEDLP